MLTPSAHVNFLCNIPELYYVCLWNNNTIFTYYFPHITVLNMLLSMEILPQRSFNEPKTVLIFRFAKPILWDI